MSKTKPTYEELNTELETIVISLQQDDIDIDVAVTQYERGLVLVKQLEDHLATATNTIEELKASFSNN
jgi:exodeoxyribonuclease VII small subunit